MADETEDRMADIDREGFGASLVGLAEAYGTEISSQRVSIYWSKLRGRMSLATFRQAIDRHHSSHRMFPVVAEILEHAKSITDSRNSERRLPRPPKNELDDFDRAVTRAVAQYLGGMPLAGIVQQMRVVPEVEALDLDDIIRRAVKSNGFTPGALVHETGAEFLTRTAREHKSIMETARRLARDAATETAA